MTYQERKGDMNETHTDPGFRKVVLFLAVLGLMGLGFLENCMAQETSIESYDSANGPYAQYPEQFDGRGVLDALNGQTVVIKDTQFFLAPSVSFNLPGWLDTSREQLKPGQFVAYILNDNGEVVSLWGLENETDLPPI